MSESAAASISASQLTPTTFQYSLTLNDTGSTTVGTFWFAWIPGQDYLATLPTGITDPTGWRHIVTGGTPHDGFAIQWTAASSLADLAAGGTLSGFSFTTTEAP
jgi:hypothetical protein